MRYSGADARPISLRDTLDSIVIVESLLATKPGGLIDPPTPEEARHYRADLESMIGTLPAHRAEIEILRHRAVTRLQHEAYRRLSRAAGGRTLDRLADHLEATRDPVRLEHTTASGELVTIALSPTAPIIGDALPCRVGDILIYLRVVAPAALLRPVTADLTGLDALALIRLSERLKIAPV